MQHASPIDNPIWSALRSLHAGIALGSGEVLRYPVDTAPFLGIAHADVAVAVADALEALVPPEDAVLMAGVAPARLPPGWALDPLEALVQMTCDSELPVVDGPEVLALEASHRADVLMLTALVYPHYFRARTMSLGRYFGLYRQGRLVAMIGERLGAPGYREMSAICTHPDWVGQGFARRLTAWLTNDTLQRGDTPFLHASVANTRAIAVYEALGYRRRRLLPFWRLRRA